MQQRKAEREAQQFRFRQKVPSPPPRPCCKSPRLSLHRPVCSHRRQWRRPPPSSAPSSKGRCESSAVRTPRTEARQNDVLIPMLGQGGKRGDRGRGGGRGGLKRRRKRESRRGGKGHERAGGGRGNISATLHRRAETAARKPASRGGGAEARSRKGGSGMSAPHPSCTALGTFFSAPVGLHPSPPFLWSFTSRLDGFPVPPPPPQPLGFSLCVVFSVSAPPHPASL